MPTSMSIMDLQMQRNKVRIICATLSGSHVPLHLTSHPPQTELLEEENIPNKLKYGEVFARGNKSD
jgi:hypothetical protein